MAKAAHFQLRQQAVQDLDNIYITIVYESLVLQELNNTLGI